MIIKKWSILIIFLFILVLAYISISFIFSSSDNLKQEYSVVEALSIENEEGYSKAIKPREFQFPEDHGSHEDFRLEWWYFTGNLKTSDNRRFGYQFTIFRIALTPDQVKRKSNWSTNQVYMGHFTLSDIKNNQFYYFERFSRGDQRLAGSKSKPFQVWIEDWGAKSEGKKLDDYGFPMVIRAKNDTMSIDFQLTNLKEVVLQGDRGLSQKGSEKGSASYYYSFTRLKTKGKIKIKDETFEVEGLSWMDREWSTTALSRNQTGWDWFSLQLDDGSEIVYAQIRNEDGSISSYGVGKIINQDNSQIDFPLDQFRLTVIDHWTSPLKGEYPSSWRLKIPDRDIDLTIRPLMKDQELKLSYRYWEGAVQIEGYSKGRKISGYGYVELTGYQ